MLFLIIQISDQVSGRPVPATQSWLPHRLPASHHSLAYITSISFITLSTTCNLIACLFICMFVSPTIYIYEQEARIRSFHTCPHPSVPDDSVKMNGYTLLAILMGSLNSFVKNLLFYNYFSPAHLSYNVRKSCYSMAVTHNQGFKKIKGKEYQSTSKLEGGVWSSLLLCSL